MKKILALVVVIAGILVGLNFYIMQSVKDTHNAIVEDLKASAKIKDSTLESGLFASKGKIDLSIKSIKSLLEAFDINDDISIDISGVLNVEYKHSFLSFLNGIDADYVFEISPNSNLAGFFKDSKIFKASVKGLKKDGSNIDIKGELEGFEIKQESEKLKFSDFKIEAKGKLEASEFFIKEFKAFQDMAKLEAALNEGFKLEGLSIEYASQNYTKIMDFLNGYDLQSNSKISLDNFTLNIFGSKVELDDLKMKFDTNLEANKVKSSGQITFDKLSYDDFKLKNLDVDLLVSGFEKSSYIDFLNATKDPQDFDTASFDLFSKNNIYLNFNKFSIENNDKDKLDFKLFMNFDKVNMKKIESEIVSQIKLDGDLIVDEGFLSYIEKSFGLNVFDHVYGFVKMGALNKNGNKFETKINLKNGKILLNDKIDIADPLSSF